MLPQEVRNVLCWENRIWCAALHFFTVIHSQSEQSLVREHHMKLIIENDHSLVELFQDVFRLAQPIRSCDVVFRHGLAQSSRPLILQVSARGPSRPSG